MHNASAPFPEGLSCWALELGQLTWQWGLWHRCTPAELLPTLTVTWGGEGWQEVEMLSNPSVNFLRAEISAHGDIEWLLSNSLGASCSLWFVTYSCITNCQPKLIILKQQVVIILHSFQEPGIWEPLCWTLVAVGLSWGFSQAVGRSAVIWTLDWG